MYSFFLPSSPLLNSAGACSTIGILHATKLLPLVGRGDWSSPCTCKSLVWTVDHAVWFFTVATICSFRTTYFTFRQTDLSTAAAWTWRPAKPRTGPQPFWLFWSISPKPISPIIYFADRFCFAEDYMDILGGHLHGPVFSTLNSFRPFCTFWDSGLNGSI